MQRYSFKLIEEIFDLIHKVYIETLLRGFSKVRCFAIFQLHYSVSYHFAMLLQGTFNFLVNTLCTALYIDILYYVVLYYHIEYYMCTYTTTGLEVVIVVL